MRLYVTGAIALFIGACVSSPRAPSAFSEYYSDMTGGVDISTYPVIELSRAEPKIDLRTDPVQDIQRMLENGYVLVGYSSFNAGNTDERDALSQARKVGASVVLTYARYTDTATGAIPLTRADSRADAYGENTIRRSDYLATYWVKLKPPVFGTRLDDLTPERRKELGSDAGMMVQAVIKKSPAFNAGIQKGDILHRIGLVEISDNKAYKDALKIYYGELANVVIYRNRQKMEKRIQLGVPR
jgi:hypothetical protein